MDSWSRRLPVPAPGSRSASPGEGLRALVLDDEPHARDEVSFLLRGDPYVTAVRTAASGATALKLLSREAFDVLFCDIRMPGLNGLELARLAARFPTPLAVVFVTAYGDHAVDAFDLPAADYVMKPVRAERLRMAVRRVWAHRDEPVADDELIPVTGTGVTRFVRRSQVRYAEAHGDYVRLHLGDGEPPLIRATLDILEKRWSYAGFARVHRGALVRLDQVDELIRGADGRTVLRLGRDELPVSRRHYRDVRDRLDGLRS